MTTFEIMSLYSIYQRLPHSLFMFLVEQTGNRLHDEVNVLVFKLSDDVQIGLLCSIDA